MYQSELYPDCSECGRKMLPIWFTDEEYDFYQGNMYKTGRKCKACSHFECPTCFHKEAVDDSLDG
jgi:hypothetical protein